MLLQAPWGDAMKTLEALGATPGGCKTKFHVIFLISKMEIMLLQSCCEKKRELTFGRLVREPQGVVQLCGRHGSGHGDLPATWPPLPAPWRDSVTTSGRWLWSSGHLIQAWLGNRGYRTWV